MIHIHVKAVQTRSKYHGSVEVCNDGRKLFKLEDRHVSKTKEAAEQYAMTLGKRFLKDLEDYKSS